MTEAVYFDGQVAADRPVTIRLTSTALHFEGPETTLQSWNFNELEAIERPHEGLPFRVTHHGQPDARLVIQDDHFVATLVGHAPQLAKRLSAGKLGRSAAWIASTLAAAAVLSYVVLQYAPQRVAFLLPDSWRDRVGAQVEQSLTGQARHCSSSTGDAAVSVLVARIAEGNPDLPAISVRIYDVPVMNAFAMPGERIVITNELIKRAARAEQVAGVLAHELGHVVHRHSEAQLVRATGLQVLISVLTGGGSDTIGSVAGMAAILSYSRGAEAEADDFAIAAMTAARIDPLGLREFFEIILEQEGKPATGTFGKIGSALSTHPGTEDRIKKIHPLPDGVATQPVLTEKQWRDLRAICS